MSTWWYPFRAHRRSFCWRPKEARLGQNARWMACKKLTGSPGKIWKSGKSQKSSLCWMAALIQKLWEVLWDMCDHCNKELHTAGTAIQQQIMHSLNDQITALYAGEAQQLPCNTLKFLQTPKEVVMQYPVASKQLWVELVKTAQQCRKVHDFRKYLGKQQFIITWLSTATQISTPQTAQPDWAQVFPWFRIHIMAANQKISDQQSRLPCHSTH